MTKTRLIGDIHGMVYDYKSYAISDWPHNTIQLGDFGIGFGQSDYWHESVNDFHSDGTHRFIRGNHDNPHMCKQEMVGYIPDGTIEDDVMFIGGAWSIDNPDAPPGWYRRTAEIDWWFEEECSDQEYQKIFEDYVSLKPRVMLTHDCPGTVSYKMFWSSGLIKGPVYYNRTAEWLNKFYEAHQPKFWFFGHWHKTVHLKYGNTHFVCLSEIDYIDLDLSCDDSIIEAIESKFN